MSGLGIFLNIVCDPLCGQSLLQQCGRAAQRAIACAEAANDRARPTQCRLGVLWYCPIVDARNCEIMFRRHKERIGAAHAEADNADLAGAVIPTLKPRSNGVDVVNRSSSARR